MQISFVISDFSKEQVLLSVTPLKQYFLGAFRISHYDLIFFVMTSNTFKTAVTACFNTGVELRKTFDVK